MSRTLETRTNPTQARQASALWCVLGYESDHQPSQFATSTKRANPEVGT